MRVFILSLYFISFSCLAKPNILWIIGEDMSPDIRAYGDYTASTPTLDALASRGVTFDRVFTTAAVCAPSRTSLALGVHQTSVDAHHMRYPDKLKNQLPSSVMPINELFRRGGYITALIQDKPASNKTDWSFAKSERTKFDVHSWEALEQSSKPFFAMYNLKMTHRPFAQDIKRRVSPSAVAVPPYYPDIQAVREDIAAYYESIQVLDGLVEIALEQLEKHGFSKNTIVIFLTDHGRPFTRAKNALYDSGTHIPVIISFPESVEKPHGYRQGTHDGRLLSAIDLVATSLALAGIERPRKMDGQAFYNGEPDFERNYVISSLDRIGGTFFKSRSIRTKTHRLTLNLNHGFSVNEGSTAYRRAMHPIFHVLEIMDDIGQLNKAQKNLVEPVPPIELYDLVNDPDELHNLANQKPYAATQKILHNQLTRWMKLSEDKGLLKDSAALEKAFSEYKRRSYKKNTKKIAALRKKTLSDLQAIQKNNSVR